MEERAEVELHAVCYGAGKMLTEMPGMATAEAAIRLLAQRVEQVQTIRSDWNKKIANEQRQKDRKKA